MAASEEKTAEKISNSSKLVVITGASSGIGEACVEPFVLGGHSVLMLARNVDKMKVGKETICGSLAKSTGKPSSDFESLIIFKKCDVSLEAATMDDKDSSVTLCHSIDSAIKECLNESNNKDMFVDCLINNAGIMFVSPLEAQPMKDINLMFAVNVNGVLNGLKAVVSGMKGRKRGTIINISSIAGLRTSANFAAYSASKFAVQALTEGLRQELAGANVKVSIVCPGFVGTNLLSTNSKEIQQMGQLIASKMELGVLLPSDIADACDFIYKAHPRCCIREIVIHPVNQV